MVKTENRIWGNNSKSNSRWINSNIFWLLELISNRCKIWEHLFRIKRQLLSVELDWMLSVESMLEINLKINRFHTRIKVKELVVIKTNTITRAHKKLVTNKFIYLVPTKLKLACINKMAVLFFHRQKDWSTKTILHLVIWIHRSLVLKEEWVVKTNCSIRNTNIQLRTKTKQFQEFLINDQCQRIPIKEDWTLKVNNKQKWMDERANYQG